MEVIGRNIEAMARGPVMTRCRRAPVALEGRLADLAAAFVAWLETGVRRRRTCSPPTCSPT